ncbi:hypothetical protein LCGC14_2178950, partial [marine sediment metagenome]
MVVLVVCLATVGVVQAAGWTTLDYPGAEWTNLRDIDGSNFVGRCSVGGVHLGALLFTGSIDEVRDWNFGFGGLPGDYEAYITWRAQGRNV